MPAVPDDSMSEGRNEIERRFLAHLASLESPYCDFWARLMPQLIVTVTISDRAENLVLRTLRVDFDGSQIVAGNDPAHQLVNELDPADADRFESPLGLDPEELAGLAMQWLRTQSARRIERREWSEGDARWCGWYLADTGHALAVTDGGVAWAAGGAWGGPPNRPPDRVIMLPAVGTPAPNEPSRV